MPRLTLVIGGARSGKSAHAEALVMMAPPPWTYIATAEAWDREMQERIDAHRSRRGGLWRTIEAPHALAAALRTEAFEAAPVLLDCLTLWLSNVMLAGKDLDEELRELLAAIAEVPGPLVVVSNEVGLGIVPDNALARRFRDAQGRLNQQVAALADTVVLMTAGIPLKLK